MNTHSDNAWRTLARDRLSRGGSHRTDALTMFSLAAMAALAGSAAWVGWTAMRPLQRPTPSTLTQLTALEPARSRAGTATERHAVISTLTIDNPFAHGRGFWESSTSIAEHDSADQLPSAPGTPGGVTKKSRQAAVNADDVTKALAALELKHIYTDRTGETVARIGFIASPTREITRAVRVSEEFNDAQHPQSPWKLVEIDALGDRVVLERSGQRVELVLFTDEPMMLAPLAPAPVLAGSAPEPSIALAGREEVARQLKQASVSDADIKALFDMLDQPAGAAPLPGVAATAPLTSPDAKRAPPPGLEEVLRIMASQKKKAPESVPPAPKP